MLILGAGGHAQMVANILLRSHQGGSSWKPIGFLDDDPALAGTTITGLPVLGTISQLGEINHDAVIVAVGDNRTRARIFKSVKGQGERIINAVHPRAVLAPDTQLGRGVVIRPCVVDTGTTVGDNVILGTGCTLGHHNHIGSHARIGPGAHLGGKVHIGEGAAIGIGAAIIPGRSVGEFAVVGAGAVVITDIPAFTTCVGVPARVIKKHRPER